MKYSRSTVVPGVFYSRSMQRGWLGKETMAEGGRGPDHSEAASEGPGYDAHTGRPIVIEGSDALVQLACQLDGLWHLCSCYPTLPPHPAHVLNWGAP